MPKVLTTNARITCPHGGQGVSTASAPKWQVDGGLVLVEGDTGVLTCPFLPLPCAGYTLRSMGLNASVVDGRKVMLVTDFTQSLTGLPLRLDEPIHQVYDDSTPAPLPVGQAAPPLAPELLDLVPPVVTAAPPALAFNSATQLPPTAAASFTLTSAFPLRWVLTLISESPPPRSTDLTSAALPGVTVAPSGGGWSSAVLTVAVTLTAAGMSALGPGLHHFFMTGVSRRGLSGLAEMVLTVS